MIYFQRNGIYKIEGVAGQSKRRSQLLFVPMFLVKKLFFESTKIDTNSFIRNSIAVGYSRYFVSDGSQTMMRAICSNRWRSTRPTIWVTNCVKHGKKSWCERRRTAKSRVCCVPPYGYSVPNSFCSASSYSHWNSFSGSNDLVNRPFGIRRAVELIFAAFSFQSTTATVPGRTGAILHTQSLFKEDECDEFWWIG